MDITEMFIPQADGDVIRVTVSGEVIKTTERYGKSHKYYKILHACIDCGEQRWVQYLHGKAKVQRCPRCARRHSAKLQPCTGYATVTLNEDDPYYAMTYVGPNNRYGVVLEHRWVMAKYLGRCLESGEIVHHKNGNKRDNRIENLELTSLGKHATDHHKGYIDGYMQGLLDGVNKLEEIRNGYK